MQAVMNAPGHQMFSIAMKLQLASEELRPWFNDGGINLKLHLYTFQINKW